MEYWTDVVLGTRVQTSTFIINDGDDCLCYTADRRTLTVSACQLELETLVSFFVLHTQNHHHQRHHHHRQRRHCHRRHRRHHRYRHHNRHRHRHRHHRHRYRRRHHHHHQGLARILGV